MQFALHRLCTLVYWMLNASWSIMCMILLNILGLGRKYSFNHDTSCSLTSPEYWYLKSVLLSPNIHFIVEHKPLVSQWMALWWKSSSFFQTGQPWMGLYVWSLFRAGFADTFWPEIFGFIIHWRISVYDIIF